MVQEVVVESPAGAFRGEDAGAVHVFRGIRYGQPPTGERRWRDPVAAAPAEGVVDALVFGTVAPQQENPVVGLGEGAVQDEDCLFLNVWRPAAAEGGPRAVMVWLHGGAYTYGSGTQPMYDATRLVAQGDVLVVTLNYRIAALGFLDLTGFATPDVPFDGNLALKDVLLALRWVQANIAAFGGDPARVTVFGESAGGGLVTTLLATPSAAELFSRAIAESAPVSTAYGPARARTVAARFLELAGVDAGDPAALRALGVDAIVAAGTQLFAEIPAEDPGTIAYAPVVDGDLVPEAPVTVLHEGRALPVPLLIGTNKDEASFFKFMKSPLMPITDEQIDKMFRDLAEEEPELLIPDAAQVRAAYEGVRHRSRGLGIARDIGFRMPTVWAAEGHAAVAPVWLYRFDFTTPFFRLLGLGATHGAELPYVWGNLDARPKDPTFRLGGRRAGERLSERMLSRWTAFARGEAPDAADAVAWPQYGPDARASLVIDHDDRVADVDEALRSGWGDVVLAFA
ncbi:carboxylesterase/lipase family protein [Microbacterium sp. X-17]|uniref:carboxylesterase/lipase family protein n=1 Tax=Microbacterium sp. X-17 TaxID=3144404 RepID=UPI0031F53F84